MTIRAKMPRAVQTTHLNRIQEVTCLLVIILANWATPDWTGLVSVRLQDVFLLVEIRVLGPAHVADRNVEDTFPRSSLFSRVRPAVGNGVVGAVMRGLCVVVETGGVMGVERRVEDILKVARC